MTSPLERYYSLVEKSVLRPDPAQRQALGYLQGLFEKLVAEDRSRASMGRWRAKILGRPAQRIKGLYLWGDVGRGKTLLLDLLYECLPFSNKLRMHFHRFMQFVHAELKKHSGTVNPLETVADGLAARCRVLCFDEFYVSDIGDAMILGGLLRALFDRDVTLVATSNMEPSSLYADGIQRRSFLPAIDLLLQHTEVQQLQGSHDHRLRALSQAEIYYTPLGEAAEREMRRTFMALAPADFLKDRELNILGRPIGSKYLAHDVVWCDFSALCDGPRSQNDYIEMARLFHAVLLSGVPCFSAHMGDQARRFVSLVDEFYDHNVKLILSAAAAPTDLYAKEGGTIFEFARAESRLIEMQSQDYLARRHRG